MIDTNTLPFIAVRQDGAVASHWAPTRTGDYTRDCAAGRAYARQFIAEGNASLLPWIVAAMPRGAEMGAVEIGFLTCVATKMN